MMGFMLEDLGGLVLIWIKTTSKVAERQSLLT